MSRILSLLFVGALVPTVCSAEFMAIGPYEAEVCTGFVIKKCSLQRIDAIKKNGEFFEIKKHWNSVNSYEPEKSQSQGRCTMLFSENTVPFFDAKPDFYRYGKNGTGKAAVKRPLHCLVGQRSGTNHYRLMHLNVT